jgi:hypothetical protein
VDILDLHSLKKKASVSLQAGEKIRCAITVNDKEGGAAEKHILSAAQTACSCA